jgi:NAD(P)-dependent dehydrogenase (short-subunit alcohol dehydrogenase family)
MDLGFAGATADELSGCGSPDAFGVVADTTDPARVEAAFAELGERWNGELNVLINTVGQPRHNRTCPLKTPGITSSRTSGVANFATDFAIIDVVHARLGQAQLLTAQ